MNAAHHYSRVLSSSSPASRLIDPYTLARGSIVDNIQGRWKSYQAKKEIEK